MTHEQRRNFFLEIAVVVWAIAVATYSQYPSLVNRYIVNGDAPAAITWLYQFRDPSAFNDDLLTHLATQIHGQIGFAYFYRMLAPVLDPLLVSRFIPIVLLAIFAIYTFWFVRLISTTFTALMAAGLAIVVPMHLDIISGGHQRAFALPMLMAFLYYLATPAWGRACVVLVLQALFYPMAFLICVPTFAMALVAPPGYRLSIRERRGPFIWFVAVVAVCVTLLAARNVIAPDPVIGPLVTRAEMQGRPEFYEGGRTRVLPTRGVAGEMLDQLIGLSRSLSLDYPSALLSLSSRPNKAFVVIPLALILLAAGVATVRAVARRHVVIPPVLYYFLVSGIVLYVLADWLLFRLYLPNRYLIYTVRIAGLVIASVLVGQLVERIGHARIRQAVKVALLVAIAARADLTRNIGLTDQSAGKPIFEFLATLPPDVVIASHPDAADFIPTFAHRKVYLNFELSYPFYSVYWRTIAARTRAFFEAYYAETRDEIYRFCVANDIDYLVVRTRDFQPEYLATHRIYFEPFNTEIRQTLRRVQEHALTKIAPEEMLFRDGDTFVIGRDVLKGSAPDQSAQSGRRALSGD